MALGAAPLGSSQQFFACNGTWFDVGPTVAGWLAADESIEAFFALAVPGQLAKAKQEVGDSKIRKGRWIAQNTPCPPAVNDLYRQVVVALQG